MPTPYDFSQDPRYKSYARRRALLTQDELGNLVGQDIAAGRTGGSYSALREGQIRGQGATALSDYEANLAGVEDQRRFEAEQSDLARKSAERIAQTQAEAYGRGASAEKEGALYGAGGEVLGGLLGGIFSKRNLYGVPGLLGGGGIPGAPPTAGIGGILSGAPGGFAAAHPLLAGAGKFALTAAPPLAAATAALVLRNQIKKGLLGRGAAGTYQGAENLLINRPLNYARSFAKQPTKAVANVFKGAFCFSPYVIVEMADGRIKAASQMELGDRVKEGGRILSVRESLRLEPIYLYRGVHVTGLHAVLEDGTWIRVKDSAKSFEIDDYDAPSTVFSFVTENHRVSANGVFFADEHETDDYETLDLDESLARLNELEKGAIHA